MMITKSLTQIDAAFTALINDRTFYLHILEKANNIEQYQTIK